MKMNLVVQSAEATALERVRKQTGVIPFSLEEDGLWVLLIRSSHGGNWGIPKGKKEKGLSKKGSAQVEAWEEAGLKGKVKKRLGEYGYTKGFTGVQQNVIVYAMRVDKVKTKFPEAWRDRMWFRIDLARKKLGKKLQPMLDELERLYGG